MNSGESTKNPLPYRHMVFYFSCLVFVVLFVFLECSKSFPTSSGHSPEHTLGSWLYLILWKTQKVEVRSPLLDAFSVADNSLPLPESPLANLFLYWFEKKKQLWRLRWPLSPDILLTRCIKCPFFSELIHEMSQCFSLRVEWRGHGIRKRSPCLAMRHADSPFSVLKDKMKHLILPPSLMLAVIRSILMQQLHRGEYHKGRQISDLKEIDTLMGEYISLLLLY